MQTTLPDNQTNGDRLQSVGHFLQVDRRDLQLGGDGEDFSKAHSAYISKRFGTEHSRSSQVLRHNSTPSSLQSVRSNEVQALH